MGTVIYQVIHNRVARQFATGFRLLPEEWDDQQSLPISSSADNERKSQLLSICRKIRSDTSKLLDIITLHDRSSHPYTAEVILSEFRSWKSRNFTDGYVDYCEQTISRLLSLGRRSAALKLRTSLNSFVRFLDADDVSLRDVDSHLMEHYELWMKEMHLSANGRSFYLRNLRSAYNNAVDDGLVPQNDPFRKVYTGTAKTEKRALTFRQMQALKKMTFPGNRKLEFARDVFLLCFYLRGIPPIDLGFLRKSDLRNGIITYHRRKTGQKLIIRWEPCMQDLLLRLWKLSGSDQSASPLLLPIIPISGPVQATDPQTLNRLYYNASRVINNNLRKLGEILSLSHVLTLYVARHSWASIAKNRNIPLSVISEGLGHDNERTTQIYLASIDNGILDAANRKVLRGL